MYSGRINNTVFTSTLPSYRRNTSYYMTLCSVIPEHAYISLYKTIVKDIMIIVPGQKFKVDGGVDQQCTQAGMGVMIVMSVQF